MNINEAGFVTLTFFGFLDGKLTDSEVSILDHYLKDHYRGDFSLLNIANTFTSKDIRGVKQKTRQLFQEAIAFLQKEADQAYKKQILDYLVKVGIADGSFCSEQVDTLKEVLNLWKVEMDLNDLKSGITSNEDEKETGSSFDKLAQLVEKYENLFSHVLGKKKKGMWLWMAVALGVGVLAILYIIFR